MLEGVAGDKRVTIDAAALVALVGCLAVAERLDVARRTGRAIEAAGGSGQAAKPGWLPWVLVGVIGCALWLYVVRRARAVAVAEADPSQSQHFANLATLSLLLWLLWLAIGGTAVHLVVVAIAFAAIAGPGRALVGDPGQGWRRASAIRVQVIVLLGLLAVVLLVPLTAAQMLDVLRAWGDESALRAIYGLAAALLLGAVCRASAQRLLLPEHPEAESEHERSRLAAAGALALALVAMLALVQAWLGLAAMGAGALVWASTKGEVPLVLAAPDPAEHAVRSMRLAAVLGTVPLLIVFAALAEATVDSWLLPATNASDVKLLVLTIVAGVLLAFLAAQASLSDVVDVLPDDRPRLVGLVGGLLAVGGTLLAWRHPGELDVLWALPLAVLCGLLALRLIGSNGLPELWGGGGVALGTAVAVYLHPIGNTRVIGSIGLVFIGVAGMLVALYAAAAEAARRTPKLERWWLPRRVPVVTLLVVWVAVAALTQRDDAHQARTIGASLESRTLDDAARTWLDRQGAGNPDYLPVVLVAASGGGSKAAYWTDLVLDCIAGEANPGASGDGCEEGAEAAARRKSVLLTSSVSGGSVGVYHYLRNAAVAGTGSGWVDAAAGREVLSPVTGWGTFHDAPSFLLGVDANPRRCTTASSCAVNADRTLVQEAAIERFPDNGIVPPRDERSLQATGDDDPITIFNGAVSGGDGRVLLSPLQLAPPRSTDAACQTPPTGEPAAGSVDAYDLFDTEHDLPLITAVMLSARFPVIAPPGRLGIGHTGGSCHQPPLPPIEVRDGGYVENTGLLTITDLLPALRSAVGEWKSRISARKDTHVQFVVVSIDDDPTVLDGTPALGGPPPSRLSIAQRAGPAYLSRMTRDRITSCQYPDVSYFRISPPLRPGAHAATGWEISTTSRRKDLAKGLSDHAVATRLQKIRDIVDGESKPTDCG